MAESLHHSRSISLRKLELIEIDVPQKMTFSSGIGVRRSRRALIIRWIDEYGRIGYGECSARPDPFYSAEFLSGSIRLVKDFVVPHLQAQMTLRDLYATLDHIRGWPFTKAAVEAAAFQILLKDAPEKNIAQLLELPQVNEVPVGISIGIHQSDDALNLVIDDALEAGYHRLKFKISPHIDIARFQSVESKLLSTDVLVSFDANGSFGSDDIESLSYYVNTFNAVIEQPFSPDRYDVLLSAKEVLPELKICFDEEVKSMGDLVKLHNLGIIDELNLKPGRVGGIRSSLEILRYCREHRIPCWIGGMFETGVGRSLNLQIAASLPDARAHDLSPSSRYFEKDIVTPPLTMKHGYIDMHSLSQSEVDTAALTAFTVNRTEFEFDNR